MAQVTIDLLPPLLFFVLYAAFFGLIVWLYATKQVSWKSRYTVVLIHVVFRLVGMALGAAFSVMSWGKDSLGDRLDVLIAYLVFSAEGYFSLIVCAYRFLIVWQREAFGDSAIEPKPQASGVGQTRGQKWHRILSSPRTWLEWVLVAANAIIIAGSSMAAGNVNFSGATADEASSSSTAKTLRVTGTALFVGGVQLFALYGLRSYRQASDTTLALILCTWPLLTIRGVYGILSAFISSWSYSNLDAYTNSGFSATFLAAEYSMGIAMEWLACAVLLATHWTSNGSQRDRPTSDVDLESIESPTSSKRSTM